MASDPSGAADSVGSRRAALVVALAFFMENLDATVLATALPTLARAFGSTPTTLSLGITVYAVALAAFIPASGWMADRFGTRTVFCAAIGVFTFASVLCGASQNLETFIAARALQGAAAAMMSPIGRLAVLQATPKSQLIAAIAVITWPGLVAPVVGPALGGFLVTYASWRWIFFVNVPIGIALMFLVVRYVGEFRHPERRAFDVPGFVLAAGGLAALLVALHLVGRGGLELLAGIAIGVVGASLLFGAVRRALRVTAPIIDLSVLAIPTFRVSAISAGSLFRMTAGAMPVLLPLCFQLSFGMPAFEAGLLVLAYAGGNLAMKSVTTAVLKRFGFWSVLVANGGLAAALILACAFLTRDTPILVTIAVLAAAGCFRSLQLTSIQTLTFADVSPTLRSAATTLSATLQQLAISLGVAMVAVVLSLSAAARGGDPARLTQVDFQVSFAVLAILAIASAWRFASLDRNAGSEISGRSKDADRR